MGETVEVDDTNDDGSRRQNVEHDDQQYWSRNNDGMYEEAEEGMSLLIPA